MPPAQRPAHWHLRSAACGDDAGREAAALAFAASTPALEDDRDRIEAVRAWAGGAAALPFDARLKLVALQLEFYADAEPLDPRVRSVLDALDAAWCGD